MRRRRGKALKEKTILIADFETITDGTKDQEKTDVWADAEVDLYAPDDVDSVIVGTSLHHFMETISDYKSGTIAYFHNLKFDGSFIIDYLLRKGYTQGYTIDEKTGKKRKSKAKELGPNEYSAIISSKGIWYTITFTIDGRYYEIRDSLKLLPFSVRQIGESFKTLHRKLEIDYVGNMKPGGTLTKEQHDYIANDVLVIKEALSIMFNDGHNKLTIGSCCLSEYKSKYDPKDYKTIFPSLYGDNYRLTPDFGSLSAGDYIRKSYKGGWCYLRPDRANTLFTANLDFNGHKIAGTTADVNSLYPSMMESSSGNRYPIGMPHFFKGDVPDFVKNDNNLYYFIRLKTRFYIKPNHLPTIQIKHSPLYHAREWLTSSDYIDENGNAWTYIEDDINNKRIEMIPELTLTMTDYQLMQDHYNLKDTEILDGCWFYTESGLFDDYINKYAEIKKNSKGAQRQEAKLFLNNLYGKFATSTDASYKEAYIGEDDKVHFITIEDQDIKRGAFIPTGAAITSFSRNFTIRAAQKNFDTFVYSDTDSIHLLCTPDEVKGAPEDPVEFNHWKYEACWDKAIFCRAKTYIEHVTHENREKVDEYYNVRCAGMPDRAKTNFLSRIEKAPLTENDNVEEYCKNIGIREPSDEEIEYYKGERLTLEDFKVGLTVPGSLKPKRITGGIILVNGLYVMRPGLF